MVGLASQVHVLERGTNFELNFTHQSCFRFCYCGRKPFHALPACETRSVWKTAVRSAAAWCAVQKCYPR
jgi:hypothetical protein